MKTTSQRIRRRNNSPMANREFFHHIFEHLELESQPSCVRTMLPTLIIGGGGIGAATVRRTKWNLSRTGVLAHVRFLVLDTDETSQNSEGELPGLSEGEFCHLSIERVRDVLNDPLSHKLLAERVDLADESIRSKLLAIVDRGIEQAGQVRPIGLLAFWANQSLVRRKLEQQLSDLRGLYSQLEQQLATTENVRLRPRLHVILTGSLAGGTNSSFCVDLVVLLRHLLSTHPVEITGCFFLPNVLDEKLSGKPEEYRRVRANAYDAVQAIDAFDDGFGATQQIQFGVDERESIPVPSMLFNQIYVVERFTADGRDLRTLEAVEDLAALHIAADIGSAIGDQLDTTDANDVTRQNLAPDPATGRPRRFSTIGAASLGIPVKNLYRYCVARQLLQVCDELLGTVEAGGPVDNAVNTFLNDTQLADEARGLASTYRTAVAPSSDVYLTPLFQRLSANGREYYRNGELPSRLQGARQQFRDNHLPKITSHLQELVRVTIEQCERQLKRRAAELSRTSGTQSVSEFTRKLVHELDRIEQGLSDAVNKTLASAMESDKRGCGEADRLRKFPKKLLRDRTSQDRVANHYRQSLSGAIDCEVRRAIVQVVQRLRARCERYGQVLDRSIDVTRSLQSDCEKIILSSRPSASRVTTAAFSEIDISTPELFDEFFQENRSDATELIQRAATESGVSLATARQSIAGQGEVFHHLVRDISSRFSKRIGQMTVAQHLEKQLASGGRSALVAQLKLKEALRACQPMARLDPGRLDVVFGDSVSLGVPAKSADENREHLTKALRTASAAMQTNPRYMSDAQIVPISEPHRVIALRRSHGGRPHYLKCWDELKRAYETWLKDGGHPVHTFSRELVAKMPALEPAVEISRGEEAFAVALACGWIARRGPYYYWNLTLDGANGSTRRAVRLISEWDGIAFVGSEPKRGNSLQSLIRSGRIVYLDRTDGDTTKLLASGLENARRALLADREKIEAIHSTFNDLRAAAGDQQVLAEFNDYLQDLPRRVKVGDTHYELVMEQVPILQQLIGKLQRGV